MALAAVESEATLMRTVVQAPGFQHQLAEIGKGFDPIQLDQFMFAWDWILARNPALGIQVIEEPPIWMSATIRSYHLAPVNVFYSFTQTHVHLLGIRLASDTSGYD